MQILQIKLNIIANTFSSFHIDDEASWLRNTELHPRWAAPFDLRHLGLKRYPL